ncbi:MAG TPA: formyltransferase family protein [Burkholderiales bacterium]|nr:formyltransferase family protein [Burkholderiales bacterium]
MRVILLSCAGAPFSAEMLEALGLDRPELLHHFQAAILSLPHRSPLAGLPKHKQIAAIVKQKGWKGLVREARLAFGHRLHRLKSKIPGAKALSDSPLRIEAFCDRHRIPYRYTRDINDSESIAALQALDPDIVLIATFNHILKREAIGIARIATLNVHPSYLPNYRGADPIGAALRDRASESGVSLHWIDEGIDTGDIAHQRAVTIERGSDAVSLRRRLAKTAAELVASTLDDASRGRVPRQPQHG